MRRVVVNIDRLVLKGIRFEDRHAVAQELQEQLTRLLAAPGMAERIRRTGSAPRLAISLRHGAKRRRAASKEV
mgnify:CR=1 FL=1